MNQDSDDKKDFKIPLNKVSEEFEQHLSPSNNTRILVSAKFGIGKTYFLNEFFNSKKNEYDVYHLFPVNYQISSNEDIIELLKYDILVELLRKDSDIFQENDFKGIIDYQRMLCFWGTNKIQDVVKTSFSYIQELGRPLQETINLFEKFLDFKKGITAGDKGRIDSFLKMIKEKNIEESDYMSHLLQEKINKTKNKKESILILDDLDRIDPEHIFRILNIFSAHFDTRNKAHLNKFGFDKIILVADINNLKSIFHHRYGLNTDSNGYLDKFYSHGVFEYKNEKGVKVTLDDFFSHFIVKDEDGIGNALKDKGFVRLLLEDIIVKSIDLTNEQKLNLRQLLTPTKFPLFHFNKQDFDDQNDIISSIHIALQVLISIFGGIESNLIDTLTGIKNKCERDFRFSDTKITQYYGAYSFCLLEALGLVKDSTNVIKWSAYQITYGSDQVTGITTDNTNLSKNGVVSHSVFFYALLIEYMNTYFSND